MPTDLTRSILIVVSRLTSRLLRANLQTPHSYNNRTLSFRSQFVHQK